MASQLIVGAGKFGQRFYRYLQSLQLSPITLSKSPKDWSSNHIQLDLLDRNFRLPLVHSIDQVFIILAPARRTEESYQQTYIQAATNLIQELKKQQNNFHCTFLSATSVYGADQFAVIDEDSLPQADNFRGEILLKAEANIKSLHDKVSIVRASGLYSSSRERLTASILDPNKSDVSKWLNLIHEDDLCQWIYKASINKWPLTIASDAHPFTRGNRPLENKAKNQAYRQFRSIHLKHIQLSFPSFNDWYKCQ